MQVDAWRTIGSMANGLAYSRVSHDVVDTKRFAATLAPFLRAGDVIMLNGDLGAGKTQFVQGAAYAMGVVANVVSPTFNIVLQYTGKDMDMFHFDLYRLEDCDQLEDIGYWEILEGDGVSFIEWGDKFPQSAPLDYLEIRMQQEAGDSRTIMCRAHGERARRLLFLWAHDPQTHLDPVPDHKRRL